MILKYKFTDPGIDCTASALPSATLFFPTGSPVTNSPVTSSFQCFTVPIVDDVLFDEAESFQLSLILSTLSPLLLLMTTMVSIPTCLMIEVCTVMP